MSTIRNKAVIFLTIIHIDYQEESIMSSTRSTALRVKELLREKGWTTKVLAEKTGMSESYLTHIKNGTRRWNEDALRKLANAFEIHPIDLFAHRKNRTDNIDNVVQ